mgnify:CR=1 FL=1
MIILGIIGEMAAGKTTATDYIASKFQAATYRFSDIMRDLLRRLYLTESRDNLIQISIVLRQEFGNDLFAKAMAEDIKKDTANAYIVAEGVRRSDDITYLKKISGFHLIAITADMKTRYERLSVRSENSDDKLKSYEDFVKDHERETEKSIIPLLAEAEYTIDNNGSIEELYASIDALLAKLSN